MTITQYSVVKVVKFLRSIENYRSPGSFLKGLPQVGDTGVVLELYHKDGVLVNITVEHSDADGVSGWLCDFAPEEVEFLSPHYLEKA